MEKSEPRGNESSKCSEQSDDSTIGPPEVNVLESFSIVLNDLNESVIIQPSIVTREFKNWIENIEIEDILLEMNSLIYEGY